MVVGRSRSMTEPNASAPRAFFGCGRPRHVRCGKRTWHATRIPIIGGGADTFLVLRRVAPGPQAGGRRGSPMFSRCLGGAAVRATCPRALRIVLHSEAMSSP